MTLFISLPHPWAGGGLAMAIRALGERDRAEVMRLLTPERTLNLFMIGDVEIGRAHV